MIFSNSKKANGAKTDICRGDYLSMKLFVTGYRGHFNKYRKGIPFFETLTKDIGYAALWLRNYFKNGFKSRTILVYPHYPSRGSTIYKVGKAIAYNISNKPKKDQQFAVYWEYLTFREEYQFLEKLAAKIPVLNLYSRDISKIFIDKIHQEVFGYSTKVNPEEYSGKIVQKSDVNALHDGQILDAPMESRGEEYIYQILIDNQYSEDLVLDLRVPVAGKVLDFTYLKYRDIRERFLNTTTNTEVAATTEVFSKEEIDLLNEYCSKLQLEYGELDVLRNKHDGKIYVVDVNNTPQGPPANTPEEKGSKAIAAIGAALLQYANNES